MTGLRAPTMAELVVLIRAEHDPGRRARLEDWYWSKAVDRYGAQRARYYRAEYAWLQERGAT